MHVQSFRPGTRIDPHGQQLRFVKQALEVVAQCLAALGEGRLHHPRQLGLVAIRPGPVLPGGQAHNGRLHLGGWEKGLGWHIQQVFDLAMVLGHDAQAAPVLVARGGGQALYHFQLQHEMHVAHHRREFQQVENQWRGNVVGQVADDSQWLTVPSQAGEIKIEGIRAVQVETGVDAESCQQPRAQVAIQLNRVQADILSDQCRSQSPLPRANLDQVVTGLGVNGIGDAGYDAGVLEEVLAEALAGGVGGFHGAIVRWSTALCTDFRPTELVYSLPELATTAVLPMSLRHYLTLVDTMARLSLKADASRYFFGYIWWILEPLLYVLVFYVVFELILQNRREDFLVFLMCGKLTFIWFSKSVTQASRSIVNGKGLIGKISVPKSLFPIAVIQEGLYKQAAVFALLFAVVLGSGYAVSDSWAWLLPIVMVNYLMIVAGSLIAAYLVCLVFDFHVLVSMGMVFLLFVSGIFWDPRDLPDPAMTETVLALNPLAFIVDAYRQVLMAGVSPELGHLLWIGAASIAVILFMLGLMRRSSEYLALKVVTS